MSAVVDSVEYKLAVSCLCLYISAEKQLRITVTF